MNEFEPDDGDIDTLSEFGMQRRAGMLPDLMGDMRQVHRRRRLRRRALQVGAVPLLALTVALIVVWRSSAPIDSTRLVESPFSSTNSSIDREPAVVADDNPRAVNIAHIQTDPSILKRYAPRPAVRTQIAMLDDDDLLQALSQLQRPAGLIRTGQTVRLTREVADNPS